jgi:two-component system, OmpR family, sensor histidine kinase QseC
MNAIYKIFQRPIVLTKPFQRSLLQRVILGQFLILVIFCTVVSANLLWQFRKADSGEVDKQLSIVAKSLASSLQNNDKTVNQLQQKLSFYDAAINDQIVIYKQVNAQDTAEGGSPDMVLRVLDNQAQEIYRSKDYPQALLAITEQGSRQVTNLGIVWRMHIYRAPDSGLVIQIAQQTGAIYKDLLDNVRKFIVIPLLWFVPLTALVTYFVTIKGLQPLRQLAGVIAQRHPNDMRPLTNVASYSETQPLVNEINSLLQKLETTLQRERDFLADAAHELRTPLAVIQTQVHVLKHANTDTAKNAASDELNIGIERAASLVQKLLLTAKVSVDNFKPRFETLDLTAFVQERVAAFAALAALKNIDIELDAPRSCGIVADRETFISAVDNVLDNAIRYTPDGGQINVCITPAGSGKVCLRVADNGMGIPPELHDRVLERFFRVAGTEQQGSGLGLAIVKRVLALHGGDVAFSLGLGERGLAVDLTMPAHA